MIATDFGGVPVTGGTVLARLQTRGEVAQLVEHTAENRGVAGSSPALAIPLPCACRLRRLRVFPSHRSAFLLGNASRYQSVGR